MVTHPLGCHELPNSRLLRRLGGTATSSSHPFAHQVSPFPRGQVEFVRLQELDSIRVVCVLDTLGQCLIVLPGKRVVLLPIVTA